MVSTDAAPVTSRPCHRDETARYERMLIDNLALVKAVVRDVARRYRMKCDQAEELYSLTCLKLVKDGYRVLRRFEGRSAVKTYLTRVVTRIWLDARIAETGKWRPSAAACRLGPAAIALERLRWRDGWSSAEACTLLATSSRYAESVAELRTLDALLPERRCPVRFVPEEVLHDRPSTASLHGSGEDDDQSRRHALAVALRRMSAHDRRLLAKRFHDGHSVARIARDLAVDQQALYRRFDRLFQVLLDHLTTTTVRGSVAGSAV